MHNYFRCRFCGKVFRSDSTNCFACSDCSDVMSHIDKIVSDCVKNAGPINCGCDVENIDILVQFVVERLQNRFYCCDGEYFLAGDINDLVRSVVEQEYEFSEEISSYTDADGRRHSVIKHEASCQFSRGCTKSGHDEYIDAEIIEDVLLDEDGYICDVVSTMVKF